jgi:hypothetical protein
LLLKKRAGPVIEEAGKLKILTPAYPVFCPTMFSIFVELFLQIKAFDCLAKIELWG